LIEGGDGRRLVLKIANALEDRAMLDAQQRALDHLASRGAPTPSVIPTVNGVELTTITTAHREHAIWAVSVLPGRPMSSMANRPQEFHFDLGRVVGSLGDALETFDHPAAHREFYWDVARARAIVEEHQHLVADEALRRTLAKLTGEFDTRTRPLLDHLPLGVVHGDLNDNNILIARDNAACAARVSGIVDFGDMVYTYRIADLAIAIAYAILGSDDPLTVAAHVVRGFSSVRPPSDDDLSTLFGLVCIRLCASVCIAADQQRRRPDNAYLGVSQTAIGAMLPLLARIPFRLAECVFRDAAGGDPLRASSAVVQYLKRATFAPVLGIDLRIEPTIVLDLGIASPMLSGNVGENNEPSLTSNVFGLMARAGVRVSIGQYDEPRLLYVAPEFALGPRPTDEHRTIHIGLDLFAPAGTPVFAPLDGVVHAFHDNATLLDYGPVIILRHATDDGQEFFTLYGHLSRESLRGLEAGKRVRAGERIATLGTASENVGWTPHLHLQIIVDLLGLETDFPGVARPTQRRVWTSLSPDPNLIVGVPASAFPNAPPPISTTHSRRRERIGGNLSIAYREPVRVVRGWMQYLY